MWSRMCKLWCRCLDPQFVVRSLQAIKNSECYVDDMAKANIIYVYDYCYYIWWLATVHSALGVEVFETPGDYLVKVSSMHA